MALDDAAEFHPYVFCVLKKAGRDPWADLRWVTHQLGLGPLPAKPPRVSDLGKHRTGLVTVSLQEQKGRAS